MDPFDGPENELSSQGAEWARLSSEWYRRATAWSTIATRWGTSSDPRLRALSGRADAMSRQAHRLVAHLRIGALELLDLATR